MNRIQYRVIGLLARYLVRLSWLLQVATTDAVLVIAGKIGFRRILDAAEQGKWWAVWIDRHLSLSRPFGSWAMMKFGQSYTDGFREGWEQSEAEIAQAKADGTYSQAWLLERILTSGASIAERVAVPLALTLGVGLEDDDWDEEE